MLSKDQAGRVRVAAAEDKAAAAKVELESLQRVDWLHEQNKTKERLERYKYVVCIHISAYWRKYKMKKPAGNHDRQVRTMKAISREMVSHMSLFVFIR
jgi:hypothetical protein